MDGIPDNQPSRNIFDAFLRTTKSLHPLSAPHNIRHLFHGRGKIFLVPAVGLLAIGVPFAAAESFSSHSNGPAQAGGSSNPSPAPDSVNNQNIQFQQKSSSTNTSSRQESSLTVNGQAVPIPENGHFEQTFSDGTQSTTVQIDSRSQRTSTGNNTSNTSHSSVNIQSNSTNESRGSP